MTPYVRRRARRRKPDGLPSGLATLRRDRREIVGTVAADLLGQDRFREVVALALLLGEAGAERQAQSEMNVGEWPLWRVLLSGGGGEWLRIVRAYYVSFFRLLKKLT